MAAVRARDACSFSGGFERCVAWLTRAVLAHQQAPRLLRRGALRKLGLECAVARPPVAHLVRGRPRDWARARVSSSTVIAAVVVVVVAAAVVVVVLLSSSSSIADVAEAEVAEVVVVHVAEVAAVAAVVLVLVCCGALTSPDTPAPSLYSPVGDPRRLRPSGSHSGADCVPARAERQDA